MTSKVLSLVNGHASASPNGKISINTNIGEIEFPSSKLLSLILTPATEAERKKIWATNSKEWRGALTHESYLRREAHLSNQDFTAGGGLTLWILTDSSNSRRHILSSCETYRKKAIVAIGGKVETVVSHGIGSVFCPPEYRGRGYGARMMQELATLLKTWGVRDGETAAFSILYSDIGKQFYHKFGWEPFNSSHISIPTSLVKAPSRELPQARPLYSADLAELCMIDEQLVRSCLSRVPKDKTYVALIPDIATIRWHHAREEFVAQDLHDKVPDVKGAMVGTEFGQRVWCYFTRAFYNGNPAENKGNTLHILRIVVEEHGLFTWEQASADADLSAYVPAIAALFKLALEEAEKWNMAAVEAWNPTKPIVQAAQVLYLDANVVHRDAESIASLMWYGPRKQDGPIAEEVDWLGNEKYGWC